MDNSYFEDSFRQTFVGYDAASVSSSSYAPSKSINNLESSPSEAKNIADGQTKKTVKDRIRRLRNFFCLKRRRKSTKRRTLVKVAMPAVELAHNSCSVSSMASEHNAAPIQIESQSTLIVQHNNNPVLEASDMPNSGSFKNDGNGNIEKVSVEKEEWPWDEILADTKKLKDTGLDRIYSPLNSGKYDAGILSRPSISKSRKQHLITENGISRITI